MSDNIFEVATRKKYRFTVGNGSTFSTEDLWDIPLTSRDEKRITLDRIAIFLYKESQELSNISFVSDQPSKNSEVLDKLELVKYVIKVKRDEQNLAETAKLNKEKKQKLLQIVAERENDQLKTMPLDELKKLIDSL